MQVYEQWEYFPFRKPFLSKNPIEWLWSGRSGCMSCWYRRRSCRYQFGTASLYSIYSIYNTVFVTDIGLLGRKTGCEWKKYEDTFAPDGFFLLLYCQLLFKWIHKVYSQQAQDFCFPEAQAATRVDALVGGSFHASLIPGNFTSKIPDLIQLCLMGPDFGVQSA